MSFCTQLVELESLVMGELDAGDARALRAHVATCSVCANELELLTAERALFARRAEALDALAPPPAIAAISKNAAPRSFVPALGRIALRGHFTAACAAALFVVAGLSRLGTASVSMAISDDVASMSGDEGAGSRMFASYLQQEPLACSLGGSGAGSGKTSDVMASGGTRGELFACVEPPDDAAICKP